MSKILTAAALILVVACSTTTTPPCVAVGDGLSVTAEDVKRLSPGKALVLDLRSRAAYSIDNSQDTIDLDRIVIRAADGTMTMRQLLTQRDLPLKGTFRVGVPAAVVRTLTATGGGSGQIALISCNTVACTCSGDVDCNILFSGGACGNVAVCNTDGETRCFCLRFL